MIINKRDRQINVHGRTLAYDLGFNKQGQLGSAASMLALDDESPRSSLEDLNPVGWDAEHWKEMINKPYVERLALAGAFAAAEIDRIHGTLESAGA